MPFRDAVRELSPSYLRDGVGEREMYVFALEVDYLVQKMVLAGLARMPTRCDPCFLPLIGSDRLIGQGLTEAVDSYRVRLQKAFEAWQRAGSARGVLGQVLGYLLDKTPMVRTVSSQYSGNVADLLFVTGATNASPIVVTVKRPNVLVTGDTVTIVGVFGNTGANGTFTVAVLSALTFSLDGSTGTGAYTSGGVVASSAFPSTYPPVILGSQWDTYVAGQDPSTPPVHQIASLSLGTGKWDWDSASQVIGSWGWWGAFLVVFSVAPNDWAHEATWLIGDTTVTIGTLPGSIGLDVTAEVVESIRIILRLMKGAHAWFRWIIVSFDDALFDPLQPDDGVHNPDGYFGLWSKVVGGAYVPSRFDDARYCDGVT